MTERGRIFTLEEAPRGARIIVCGGRGFGQTAKTHRNAWARRQDERRADREVTLLFNVLDELMPIEIAHGGAPGADEIAGEWAADRDVLCLEFRIDRQSENGFGRNRRMFDTFKPAGVVAFKGRNGTAHMEAIARHGGAWLVRPR